MKKGKEIIKEIRARSDERMQRIVIDEIFSDGSLRILVAEMKPGANEEKTENYASWNKEVERNLNRKELKGLLTEKQQKEIKEGQVFTVRRKRVKNISEPIRRHMKTRTKGLLAREGMTKHEFKEGR